MSTYNEIVTFIQNYHEDDSTELSTEIPNLISLAEDRIFQDVPKLISFRSIETGSLSSGVNTVELAATLAREIRDVSILDGTNTEFLFQRKEDYLRHYWTNTSTTERPKYYAIQSAADTGKLTLILSPTPDSAYAYTVNYTGEKSRLTSGNTTTFLSLVFPDALKRASVYETSIWLESAQDVLGILKVEYTEAKNMLAATVERGYLENDQ
tara:strand:- start:2838 stop:3467 length:630 start_codon:yes stop_codon:yes gene_type:complete